LITPKIQAAGWDNDPHSIAEQRKFCRHKKFNVRLGPSGIHLFDRTSGVNLLIDELIPSEAEWAMAPRQVSIALTNACDLECSYCFAPKTHASLPFDLVESWLRDLDANGTLGVGFGGGEPTLYPRFAELCAYAAENTNLAVTFTTHGHHLNDTILAHLRGKVHFVRVSMDGVGATYERLRNRPFNTLHKRLDALRTIAAFGINYVVNSDTMPDIDAAVSFAESAGASEFLLLPERPVNGWRGLAGHTVDELRGWITRNSNRIRLAISETDAEGMPTCDPLPLETGLRAYAHIDANAVLKRTSFDCDGVVIGREGLLLALRQLQVKTRVDL
jgi:MoaA/NifB/PqqE/SkfB family radical SAM enzyme